MGLGRTTSWRARVADSPATGILITPLVYQDNVSTLGTSPAGTRLGGYQGPPVAPFTSSNVWTFADSGWGASPVANVASQSDPAQAFTLAAILAQTAFDEMDSDWGALLPIDGELVAASLVNYAADSAISGWIWVYVDGLAAEATGQTALTWSLESTPIPDIAHSGGAAGLAGFAPALNNVGDRVLRLDPAIGTISLGASVTLGVNQIVAVALDAALDNLPVVAQVAYSPLYLVVR